MEGGMRDSVDGSELSLAAGVIPRAINQIFEHVRGISGDLNTVKCSFLELYNEEATDLLAVGAPLRSSQGFRAFSLAFRFRWRGRASAAHTPGGEVASGCGCDSARPEDRLERSVPGVANGENSRRRTAGFSMLAGETSVKLAIQADPSQKGGESVMVKGLEEVCVSNAADIYALLDRGSAKRRTAATLLNKQSSRSHSVFCVTVQIHEMQNGEDAIRIGKLYLVDLAGSESIFRQAIDEHQNMMFIIPEDGKQSVRRIAAASLSLACCRS